MRSPEQPDLRGVLRMAAKREPEPSAVILDSRTLRSSPESGERAGHDETKGKRGAKVHLAVDTPGHVVALHVTPAEVQAETGDSVQVGFVDQGYSGPKPAAAAEAHGIELEVVKAAEAKCGFVLLPRRWVVERSFAWATRCRRLVKDYERYASTLAGLHMVAFVCLMLKRLAQLATNS
ncbi:IS5 family transposase ISMdi26 [Methylorubrum extorquens]